MKREYRAKGQMNLIALYQHEERLSNQQLACRLGASVRRTCAVRSAPKALLRQVVALAEYEGISVDEFQLRYGSKCA